MAFGHLQLKQFQGRNVVLATTLKLLQLVSSLSLAYERRAA
jgi:hypothetical protein